MNGVAHTSRHFEAFARRRNLPFLCVRAGDRAQPLIEDGNVWTLELPRGVLSFALEKDLRFDPGFLRHVPLIEEALDRFKPDLIHITGPSEVGMLGAGLARNFNLPLAASWHTNRARVCGPAVGLVPAPSSPRACRGRRRRPSKTSPCAPPPGFYSQAQVLFAPNPELCRQLKEPTGRPCHLMPRGVDAELFHPSKRNRRADDRDQVLGFVGRLSVEKNVALLARVQDELEQLGHRSFRFLIVGHGAEEAWLRERMPRAEFTGVLRGEALSAAYANMDLFVFPSHTDTFGNVVLEAWPAAFPRS